jgi:hypothetical protein
MMQVERPGLGRSGVSVPLALAIDKRHRTVIVAKLTFLDGEPVLGIAWKEQQGTIDCISVPLVVLGFAEQQGARHLFWRRDRHPLEMRRIALADLRRWWLQADGEVYVPLSELEPVPWRRWPYAHQVLVLGEDAQSPKPAKKAIDARQTEGHQLALGLFGAVGGGA